MQSALAILEVENMPGNAAEALIPKFQFQRLLNQDQAGRRIALLGIIDSQPSILLIERAAFANDESDISTLARSLRNVQNLGSNDIYSWALASIGTRDGLSSCDSLPPDVKVNLVSPCTEKHIAKYSAQETRVITETAEIYREHVIPFMRASRESGSLNWIFNIIEGRTEQEDVIYRESSALSLSPDEGFLLLPDLNWDRRTVQSLHLLAIVERRDIWSLRDISKLHIPWLKHMRQKIITATTDLYSNVEEDQLKLYVHYQPTYYHFHIHIVHVMLESGTTQAVGKAIGLENIIAQLETMAGDLGGMQDTTITYHLGTSTDLWKLVFGPLKLKQLKG